MQPPLVNLDHNSVAIFRKKKERIVLEFRKFCDLRQSNLNKFTNELQGINCENMYELKTVNEKCVFYSHAIKFCIGAVPSYTIKRTSFDKQWITPLCKHLINLRWQAFRKENFTLYTHYKEKLKKM